MAGQRTMVHDKGSPHVAAQYVLSAGFGSTVALALAANTTDRGGRLTITPGGAGIAANPTITVAFKDGPFLDIPKVVARRADALATAGEPRVTAVSRTGYTITWVGTPVSAEVYLVDIIVAD